MYLHYPSSYLVVMTKDLSLPWSSGLSKWKIPFVVHSEAKAVWRRLSAHNIPRKLYSVRLDSLLVHTSQFRKHKKRIFSKSFEWTSFNLRIGKGNNQSHQQIGWPLLYRPCTEACFFPLVFPVHDYHRRRRVIISQRLVARSSTAITDLILRTDTDRQRTFLKSSCVRGHLHGSWLSVRM